LDSNRNFSWWGFIRKINERGASGLRFDGNKEDTSIDVVSKKVDPLLL
jgi:hypothetical protein